MKFNQELRESIAHLHLLEHPFYQKWMQGSLSQKTLQEYAQQYYFHVQAFPRYISSTHSYCENIEDRKILLENLMDEEGYNGEHHPELWARFAEGLGITRKELDHSKKKEPIDKLIKTFFTNSQSSFSEGLSSLYAYEYQIPEIAESKIEGLIKNYHIHDERSLAFFTVHKEADIYHRQACEQLLDKLPKDEQVKAKTAAVKTAQALWDFLSSLETTANAA